MRPHVLVLASLATVACGPANTVFPDTDVVDTVVVETDDGGGGGGVPEQNYEVDPDVSQVFSASLQVGTEPAQTLNFAPPDGTVAYRVAKVKDVGWFRNFGGSVTDDKTKITVAVLVTIPNDNPEVGLQSCVGPDQGYAVTVTVSVGKNGRVFSSAGLEAGDDRPCGIRIQKVSNERFTATINEATLVGGTPEKPVEGSLVNTSIDIKLRPKAE